MTKYQKLINDLIVRVDKINKIAPEIKIINSSNFNLAITELNLIINKFNSSTKFTNAINAQKLKEVLTYTLPSFEEVLDLLENDVTKQKVLTEFNNSEYLKEVWEINVKNTLYVNFLILVYRTTLLNWDVNLRKSGVQISSALEEMSALMALKGESSLVFESSKIWLQEWEKEEFSEQLFLSLKEKKLI